ncbi:MAG: hypothetical protein N3I35_08460 [Clostridia bacterium]|nr:hypothetical protein [Clostridia bacterium]
MEYARYRRHPRVYQKQNNEKDEENSLVLNVAVAAGIVVFAFAKGMFWGYMLKRKLG